MSENSEGGGEVAVMDEKKKQSISDLVVAYTTEFATALPSHLDGDQWVRQSLGALRKSPELVDAANNNPFEALRVFMEAARLGHVPGTKEFYLIPRGNSDLGYEKYVDKRGDQRSRAIKQLSGIEGYHGIVERMYRAGAVSAVKVQLVHANDGFDFEPGVHLKPDHKVNWFKGNRGDVIGGYAFADMVDGGVSQVIVMSLDEINEHRDASDSWKYESSRANSPWSKWPNQMRKKTLARALEPWVPTSSEYLREKIRIAAEVKAERDRIDREDRERAMRERAEAPVVVEGEVDEATIVEGETVESNG